MSNKNKKVELPSLLAFERKLEISDAVMHSGNWNDIGKPDAWNSKISVSSRTGRGTKSHYQGDSDKEKADANIFEGDDALLPMDKDTLRLSFTLRVIGNLGKPFACNDHDFQKIIYEKISEFKKDGRGLDEIAYRYAYNIANGRFLWRNRICAEKIKIIVNLSGEDRALDFNAIDFPLNDFDKKYDSGDLKKLKEFILKGINGDANSFAFMTVEAYAKLGSGQHVFPSQEMNMREKEKVLFKIDNCAAIHNVKIANAIRTIDNWYEGAEFPIAVEPYGSVTQIGRAFRPSKNDLYTLLVTWLGNDQIIDNDKNYVVANLIRGGLFQGEKKKKAGDGE